MSAQATIKTGQTKIEDVEGNWVVLEKEGSFARIVDSSAADQPSNEGFYILSGYEVSLNHAGGGQRLLAPDWYLYLLNLFEKMEDIDQYG